MRDVPRLVWVLAAGRFASSASSFLMLFLTLYLTGPRDLPVLLAGVVAGAYGVGMLLGNFTGGRWGDRFGHGRTLVGCSTVSGLGVAAIPWLPVAVLGAALPVLAYLSATAAVSNGALTALAVPRGDRRTSVAIGRAASNAGFVLGPPLGALLLAHSWTALFVLDGLTTLAVRVAVARSLPSEGPTATHEAGPSLWRALRADRALMRLLPAVVLVDVVYRQLYTTLPIHLRDAGQPVGLYTALIAVGSGLILLLRDPGGAAAAPAPVVPDHRGRLRPGRRRLRALRAAGLGGRPRSWRWSCSPPARSSTRRPPPRTCSTPRPTTSSGSTRGSTPAPRPAARCSPAPSARRSTPRRRACCWPLCGVAALVAADVVLAAGRARPLRPGRRTPAGTR